MPDVLQTPFESELFRPDTGEKGQFGKHRWALGWDLGPHSESSRKLKPGGQQALKKTVEWSVEFSEGEGMAGIYSLQG